jgi:TetR/AcrR family transcriptional regulator, regulator of autoinduction and epiphytic fitness
MTRVEQPPKNGPLTRSDGRLDGRAARAARTRKAVVDAHVELLRAGDLKPTGERIAERAGVSLRALWTNFKDMEALFGETVGRLLDEQAKAFRPVQPDLPLPVRVAKFCEQRAHAMEAIGPFARAARIREPFSAQLRRSRTIHVNRVRAELETLFAAELDADGERRTQLLDALLVASTFSSWSMLRDDLGLCFDGACAVITRNVGALLRC